MRKLTASVLSVVIFFSSLTSSFAQVQKGNPLKNIPVTDLSGVLSDAEMDIDDFIVLGNTVYVTSTLTGVNSVTNEVESNTVTIPVIISSATCDHLVMELVGISISAESFNIGPISVNVSSKNNDNRLRNALCSIAQSGPNVSANTLVAKLKQVVRAF